MANNFNLRNIPVTVMKALKKEAAKESISVNVLILKFIEQRIGYSSPTSRPTYDDLDHLAGTWNKSDLNEFKSHTAMFETIDKELWS